MPNMTPLQALIERLTQHLEAREHPETPGFLFDNAHVGAIDDGDYGDPHQGERSRGWLDLSRR